MQGVRTRAMIVLQRSEASLTSIPDRSFVIKMITASFRDIRFTSDLMSLSLRAFRVAIYHLSHYLFAIIQFIRSAISLLFLSFYTGILSYHR